MENTSDKALAILLTHISHSHALLAEQLDLHTRATASRPSVVAVAQGDAQKAGDITHKENRHDEVQPTLIPMSSQQDSNQHSPTSMQHAAPVHLLPYQQELADRVTTQDSSVIFLPSGVSTTCATLLIRCRTLNALAYRANAPFSLAV